MIENEVNIFDGKIILPPIDVENINSVINLPFETVEITSQCEEVKDDRQFRYSKKRKIRRVRAAGIF
ncbi:MAG TPA: hypothetical protein VGC76_01080 [Pyrinomonadaceae bacterium]